MKKQPKQARSRQIVSSILESATRILSKKRLSEVTTNTIAETAGVGIGSLYDYFPNKKSIVNSLVDNRIKAVVSDFKNLMETNVEKSVDAKIDEITVFFQSDFLDRKSFLKEIFILAPEAGQMESLYLARIEITEVISNYLQLKLNLKKDVSYKKSFFLVHGVLGILESYILVAPTFLNNDEVLNEVREFIKNKLSKP